MGHTRTLTRPAGTLSHRNGRGPALRACSVSRAPGSNEADLSPVSRPPVPLSQRRWGRGEGVDEAV